MNIDSFVIVKARKLPESDGVCPENRHQSKKSRGQNGAPRGQKYIIGLNLRI